MLAVAWDVVDDLHVVWVGASLFLEKLLIARGMAQAMLVVR
jgi:hypothetical protein